MSKYNEFLQSCFQVYFLRMVEIPSISSVVLSHGKLLLRPLLGSTFPSPAAVGCNSTALVPICFRLTKCLQRRSFLSTCMICSSCVSAPLVSCMLLPWSVYCPALVHGSFCSLNVSIGASTGVSSAPDVHTRPVNLYFSSRSPPFECIVSWRYVVMADYFYLSISRACMHSSPVSELPW